MDFSRLTVGELLDFLQLYRITFESEKSLLEQAADLYTDLQSDPLSRYPLPVVDLYLATEFKQSENYRPAFHDRSYINTYYNTPEQRRQIGGLFGLDPNDPDFNERFDRILAILDPSIKRYDPTEEFLLPKDISAYEEEAEMTLEQAKLIQRQFREQAEQRLAEEE